MALSESLLCLCTTQVERRDGSYVVELPAQELEVGPIREGGTYRIGLFPTSETTSRTGVPSEKAPTPATRGGDTYGQSGDGPPVEEGEIREVEIEDLGEQGDGLARIGPGYVVFVEDTTVGDRVKIRITQARANVAFGEVLEFV